MSELAGHAPTLLTHHRVLGARIRLQTRVRLAVAGAMVAGTYFARDVLGVENLDVTALVWLALFVALYNVVPYAIERADRRAGRPLGTSGGLRAVMHVAIIFDFLALTVATWLVGGARSPFIAFYLLHVILSCLLLTKREAAMIAALAYVLIAGLVLGEWRGLFPPRLPDGAVQSTGPLDARYAGTVLAVYGVLLAASVFLVITLSDRLRAGEQNLRSMNVELDRKSNLRRDYLHMALHDIQAPVGVVTTNLRNMLAGIGGTLSERHRESAERSLRRLEGTNQFLREFRMLEALESRPLAQQVSPVDARRILEELVDEFHEQAESRGHKLELDVAPALPAVSAIPALLREAVGNYLTNAIKYTPIGGHIVVRAYRRARNVCIEVEDNGIGISFRDQKRLFNEFVRLDRSGTPVADVPGTGLGLSIVRRMIEQQGGSTGVRSQPGVGSTFMLQLPAFDPESGGVRPPGDVSSSPA